MFSRRLVPLEASFLIVDDFFISLFLIIEQNFLYFACFLILLFVFGLL